MTEDQPHAQRPDHPPPEHRVVAHRAHLPDPFVPHQAPEPTVMSREDTASARGGLTAAFLGGLIVLGLCIGFALIFTDLFR